jgi:DNA polymerase I-like protein with 3'-5' exonuclease and polymerase domains
MLEGLWNNDLKYYPMGKLYNSPMKNSNCNINKKVAKQETKSEVKRNLRDCFVASDGYVLLSADYAQIELRMLAHFSKDKSLCNTFEYHEDVFANIASALKRNSCYKETYLDRSIIKQICYAIIYGASAETIAEQNILSVDHVFELMKKVHELYPEVSSFIDSVESFCNVNGHVETLLGRKRSFPIIADTELMEQNRIERQAIDIICQGSAADLIKVRYSTRLVCSNRY